MTIEQLLAVLRNEPFLTAWLAVTFVAIRAYTALAQTGHPAATGLGYLIAAAIIAPFVYILGRMSVARRRAKAIQPAHNTGEPTGGAASETEALARAEGKRGEI